MRKLYMLFLMLFVFGVTQKVNASIIKQIPNLVSISFYEQTSSVGGLQEFNFDINSTQLNQRRSDPLDSSNNDFTGVIDREFYDVFYSDADGTFNSNGEYISIEAIYDGNGGLNISGVMLKYEDNSTQYFNNVTTFVALGSGAEPSWVDRAVDGDLNTFTQMGSSIVERLRVTICLDADEDGVCEGQDNCPADYNPNQEDTFPPPRGNGIGNVCECEGDFNCDGNVDATDVQPFLTDFGRNRFSNPCTNNSQCNGDFNCDGNVDAIDVTKFLEDFGRNQFNNPCPACEIGDWCIYFPSDPPDGVGGSCGDPHFLHSMVYTITTSLSVSLC